MFLATKTSILILNFKLDRCITITKKFSYTVYCSDKQLINGYRIQSHQLQIRLYWYWYGEGSGRKLRRFPYIFYFWCSMWSSQMDPPSNWWFDYFPSHSLLLFVWDMYQSINQFLVPTKHGHFLSFWGFWSLFLKFIYIKY